MKQTIYVAILLLPFLALGQTDTITNQRLATKIKVGATSAQDSLQIAEQIYVLNAQINKDPNNLKLIKDRAMLYIAIPDFKLAKNDFEKVLKLSDTDTLKAIDLGEVYYFLGVTNFALNNIDCSSLMKAKMMGYKGNWEAFGRVCPDLK
jgi:tetratricopeptide (TPR) repeat protein